MAFKRIGFQYIYAYIYVYDFLRNQSSCLIKRSHRLFSVLVILITYSMPLNYLHIFSLDGNRHTHCQDIYSQQKKYILLLICLQFPKRLWDSEVHYSISGIYTHADERAATQLLSTIDQNLSLKNSEHSLKVIIFGNLVSDSTMGRLLRAKVWGGEMGEWALCHWILRQFLQKHREGKSSEVKGTCFSRMILGSWIRFPALPFLLSH